MPRARHFDPAEKAKILAWNEEGVPFKEIARRLNRNVAACRKVAASLGHLPQSATPPMKKRSGRPRKTTAVQDERLKRYMAKFPFKTAKELKKEVRHCTEKSRIFKNAYIFKNN